MQLASEVASTAGASRQTGLVPAGTWAIDSDRSNVTFSIRHLGAFTVTGRLTGLRGTLVNDGSGTTRIDGDVDAASVDTGRAGRDQAVRDRLLEASDHPRVAFSAARVEPLVAGGAVVHGAVTIRGATYPLAFTAEPVATGEPDTIRISAQVAVDRRATGLVLNPALETGGIVLGRQLLLAVDITAVRSEPAAGAWSTYDDFASGDLGRWATLEVPVGAGTRRHEDPNATVRVDDGVEIDIPEFSLRFDGSHMLDDPKHAFVSAGTFELPRHGIARFGVEMAAESHAGNAHDFRDGVAVFNVVDIATGTVFDFATSGERVWALHERLPIPGLADPFTYLIEAPFAGVETAPGRMNEYVIELDVDRQRARWLVDGQLAYDVALPALPERVNLGFGLFTLHPQPDGRSTSIRGQGMRGRWRSFRSAGTSE